MHIFAKRVDIAGMRFLFFLLKEKTSPTNTVMKNKINRTGMLPVLLGMAAMPAFAETYSEDATIEKFASDSTVTNNATITVSSENRTNYGFTIDAGSKVVAGSRYFIMGTGSGPKESEANIAGTFEMGSGGEFRLGDDPAGWSATINILDGGRLTAAEGTVFNLANYRGARSVINVEKGGEISGLNDINMFDRGNESTQNPVSELNIMGKVNYYGTLSMGKAARDEAKGDVQNSFVTVSDGGTLSGRNLNVASGALRNNAVLTVKGAGSSASFSGSIFVGGADASQTGTLAIHSGASFKSSSTVTLNKYGKIEIALDSNLGQAQGAIFTAPSITITTLEGSKSISLSMSSSSEPGYVEGLSAGDTIDVILFDNLTAIIVDGVSNDITADMSDADLQALLSTVMDVNFAGNSYWEAAGMEDVHMKDGDISLSLTYVPEPAALAAVFGALALAMLAMRKRA